MSFTVSVFKLYNCKSLICAPQANTHASISVSHLCSDCQARSLPFRKSEPEPLSTLMFKRGSDKVDAVVEVGKLHHMSSASKHKISSSSHSRMSSVLFTISTGILVFCSSPVPDFI